MRVMLEFETGDDVEPRYLVDVLAWGLQRHNDKVSEAAQVHGDYVIDLMAITILGAL